MVHIATYHGLIAKLNVSGRDEQIARMTARLQRMAEKRGFANLGEAIMDKAKLDGMFDRTTVADVSLPFRPKPQMLEKFANIEARQPKKLADALAKAAIDAKKINSDALMLGLGASAAVAAIGFLWHRRNAGAAQQLWQQRIDNQKGSERNR